MVEVPRWLEIPLKSMLRDLAIDFREQSEAEPGEWTTLEVADVQARVARSGCGLSYWRSFFKGFPQAPNVWQVALAYWHSLAYTKALDRWKGKQDQLPNQLKITATVQYLDKHLKKVILQAKSAYQLSEAVGLNLAKLEMIDKRKEIKPKPLVALAGVRASLDSLWLQELVAQGLGEKAEYYLCYDYSSSMSEEGLLTGVFNYLSCKKHHYCYNGAYCFDLRSSNYQLMVVFYREDLVFKREILNDIQKKQPILFYELGMIEGEPEVFVNWLKNKISVKLKDS